MKKRRLFPKSVRKHIRVQKAAIRREVLDFKQQEQKIQELYKKFPKATVKKVSVATQPLKSKRATKSTKAKTA